MSGQKTISRTLIAAAGAILLSTVAVGSAVAPAHIAVSSSQSTYA